MIIKFTKSIRVPAKDAGKVVCRLRAPRSSVVKDTTRLVFGSTDEMLAMWEEMKKSARYEVGYNKAKLAYKAKIKPDRGRGSVKTTPKPRPPRVPRRP